MPTNLVSSHSFDGLEDGSLLSDLYYTALAQLLQTNYIRKYPASSLIALYSNTYRYWP